MFPSSLVSAFDPGHDHTTDIAIEPVAALTPKATDIPAAPIQLVY
jgi:hypothetical protein